MHHGRIDADDQIQLINERRGFEKIPAFIQREDPEKKRYPEGYLFPQSGCGQPRQEPGRYFEGTFVPSTVAPQRQP
jgi:hypothetical protein